MVFRHSALSYLSRAAACAWIVCFISPCHAETVLLDFSSPTCGPCQQMRPIVSQLVAAGYQVQHVDISRDPQTASRFGVDLVPTFIVLTDGQVTSRSVGLTSYQQLNQMLAQSASQPKRPSQALARTPSTFANPVATNNTPAATANSTQHAVVSQAPRQPNQPTGSASSNPRLIEATVKVAVQDADGVSAGTGTVVDARDGEALILTCGHLFRSSDGKGPITVTLFQAGPTGAEVRSTATGRLVDFDLERDLALVSFQPNVTVRPIPIAQEETALIPGAAVTSVGCNHGQNPTVVATQITAIDRYQGSPNIEAAGAPVEGRSGGGLINDQGQLIGVCFAADPQGNEGLYASLPSIRAKLDSLGLAMVYESPLAATNHHVSPQPDHSTLAAIPDTNSAVRGQGPATLAQPVSDMPFAATVAPTPSPAVLTLAEQATLEEIQRRGTDSEVICIIRPKNPGGRSEVITLHSASPEFIKALTASAATQTPAATASQGARLLR